MADPESGFMVNGTVYPIPAFDTFDLDEAQVLYDYAGLGLEDFAVDLEDTEQVAEATQKLKNPGFLRALVHIAYRRGNPDIKPADVKAAAAAVNYLDVFVAAIGQAADADPPVSEEQTSEDKRSSSEGSSSSESEMPPPAANGGSVSPASSGERGSGRRTTGTGVSATSSPESPEPTSARSVRST